MAETNTPRDVFLISLKWWSLVCITTLLPLDLIYRLGSLLESLKINQILVSLAFIILFLFIIILTVAAISGVVAKLLSKVTNIGASIILIINYIVGLILIVYSFLSYFLIWITRTIMVSETFNLIDLKYYLFLLVIPIILGLCYWKRVYFSRKCEMLSKKLFIINLPLVLICAIFLLIIITSNLVNHGGINEHSIASGDSKRANYPNIILVTFDALSARYTSMHGFHIDTTPNLAKLSKESFVFNNMYSSCNWTMPSLASLLTGKYPLNHGIIDNYSFSDILGWKENLPYILKKNGYSTAVAWSGDYTHPWIMNLQGFQEISPDMGDYYYLSKISFALGLGSTRWLQDFFTASGLIFPSQWFTNLIFPPTDGNRSSGQGEKIPRWLSPEFTFSQALQLISKSHTPFFLWVHIFPPHAPYIPSDRFLYTLLPEKVLDNAKTFVPDIEQFTHFLRYRPKDQGKIDKLFLRYCEHICYADHEFGNFLEKIRRDEVLRQSILIVTADHGEMFERGFWSHGSPYLYQPLIHIPLIIKLPGQSQHRRIEANVSHIDIAPTILDIIGIEQPRWMDGTSFAAALNRGMDNIATQYSMNLSYLNDPPDFLSQSIMVIHKDYKLIKYLNLNRYELYDMKNDLEEKHNLIDSNPEVFMSLKKEIDAILKKRHY